MPSYHDELIALQHAARAAHLAGDADALVATFADDFVSIANGTITRPTREQSRARFAGYFAMVTFRAWDDVVPPVVLVATDGRIATILVHKRVDLEYVDDGVPTREETTFAWQETWTRIDDRWRLAVMTSTNATPISTTAG